MRYTRIAPREPKGKQVGVARLQTNNKIKTRKLKKQNETQTTYSQFYRPDRVSRADVRGCSESGARQETQHSIHHGRRHRHVEHRRLSPRADGRSHTKSR